MVTLASILVAVPLGVAGGLLLGILAFRHPWFEGAIRPVLDLEPSRAEAGAALVAKAEAGGGAGAAAPALSEEAATPAGDAQSQEEVDKLLDSLGF